MCHRGMSRTFQIPLPFPKMTVLENVMVGAQFGGARPTGRIAPQACRRSAGLRAIPVAHDTPARCCNAVQLKRLDLARAWACQPKLMLLDELASGLTPTELDDMIALIKRIRDHGVTIIAVEHIMRVIMGICDRILVIQYGSPIAEGRPTMCCAIPKSSKPILAQRKWLPSGAAASNSALMGGASCSKSRNIDASYDFLQVLWDVSLDVQEGEFVALIGPNGAGKTTTLRTTAGLMRPKKGQVVFNGKRSAGLKPHEISRMGLAYVSESLNLFTNMTVRENLLLGAYSVPDKAQRDENLSFVFELFPRLKERAGQLAGTMSGGERKMLAIARAIMSSPRAMLIDEPSLGLAPISLTRSFRAW